MSPNLVALAYLVEVLQLLPVGVIYSVWSGWLSPLLPRLQLLRTGR
jgi:hypothetical protein